MSPGSGPPAGQLAVTRHTNRPGWVRIAPYRRAGRTLWLRDDEVRQLVTALAAPIPELPPVERRGAGQ